MRDSIAADGADIYTNVCLFVNIEVTAPEGTGLITSAGRQCSLRNIDDDREPIGHDRQAETEAPTFDENIDVLTSCRVGSVHAGFKAFGMHELPNYRHSDICSVQKINPSYGANVTIKGSIRHLDAKKNNEVVRVQFFRSDVPKCSQGLSPLSSASLYLRTHSSTPCAMLANSRDSTFFSRNSMISEGKVTLRDLLRFLSIHQRLLQLTININNNHWSNTLKLSVGTSQHEQKQPTSESYGRIHRARRGKMHLHRYGQPSPCYRYYCCISSGRSTAGDKTFRGRGDRKDTVGDLGRSDCRMEVRA